MRRRIYTMMQSWEMHNGLVSMQDICKQAYDNNAFEKNVVAIRK